MGFALKHQGVTEPVLIDLRASVTIPNAKLLRPEIPPDLAIVEIEIMVSIGGITAFHDTQRKLVLWITLIDG